MRKICQMILSTMVWVMMSQAWGGDAALTATPTAVPEHAASVGASPVSATLQMQETGARLYARIAVEQVHPQMGKITVIWTPPQGSFCRASTYELSYQGKRYHTHCYRTVRHDIKGKLFHCNGLWTIEVRDANGVSLAHTTYHMDFTGDHH